MDKEKLLEMARKLFVTAKRNLSRDGQLAPCFLMFIGDQIIPIAASWTDSETKEQVFANLQSFISVSRPDALFQVLEVWQATAEQSDLSKVPAGGVKDMPGSEEAITVLGRNRLGEYWALAQVFERQGERIVYPGEIKESFGVRGEYMDKLKF